MKIKDGFLLRQIAGGTVVVPVGKASVDFNGMITLNETGAFLWKLLENDISEVELLQRLTAEYDISEDIAKADINAFIGKLKDAGLID
ncbi:MAG: PqqD family protein [Acutalibacteraceae bacterium]